MNYCQRRHLKKQLKSPAVQAIALAAVGGLAVFLFQKCKGTRCCK